MDVLRFEVSGVRASSERNDPSESGRCFEIPEVSASIIVDNSAPMTAPGEVDRRDVSLLIMLSERTETSSKRSLPFTAGRVNEEGEERDPSGSPEPEWRLTKSSSFEVSYGGSTKTFGNNFESSKRGYETDFRINTGASGEGRSIEITGDVLGSFDVEFFRSPVIERRTEPNDAKGLLLVATLLETGVGSFPGPNGKRLLRDRKLDDGLVGIP